MFGILLIIAVAVLLGASAVGARRFATRRRQEGFWDDQGPIEPTAAPAAFLQPRSSIEDLLDLREELDRPAKTDPPRPRNKGKSR
jgi:hypothetical protein